MEAYSSEDTHPLFLLGLGCRGIGLTLGRCVGFLCSSFAIFISCLQILSLCFIFPLLLLHRLRLSVLFLVFARWGPLVFVPFGRGLSSLLH